MLDFRAEMVGICYVPSVEITLQQAVSDLRQAGVLEIVEDVACEVYATNADRHDPSRGDDNGTFAQLVWRNIANLCFQRLRQAGVPVRKVAGGAIEVISGPWVMRIYKFPLVAPSKVQEKIEQFRWDGSAARLRGAVANSVVSDQLSFDGDPEWADSFAVAVQQGHVRIVHTGDFETGNCAVEIGLPRDNREGGSPWLDGTIELHNDLQAALPAPRVSTGVPPLEGQADQETPTEEDETAQDSGTLPKSPDYSDLGEHDLPLRRRTDEPREKRDTTD
ncbi:hypothetical protein AB0E82_23770 [Streptomyces anulatus]|uniref:hypothetical protein n=1 Tax=Streptomyces griseus group TaxID=629295 RepID=UPI0033E124FC